MYHNNNQHVGVDLQIGLLRLLMRVGDGTAGGIHCWCLVCIWVTQTHPSKLSWTFVTCKPLPPPSSPQLMNNPPRLFVPAPASLHSYNQDLPSRVLARIVCRQTPTMQARTDPGLRTGLLGKTFAPHAGKNDDWPSFLHIFVLVRCVVPCCAAVFG